MYVYVAREQKNIYNNYNRWSLWKDGDKTVKITSQGRTNQPGEQVGKRKTKGRGAWLALNEREREREVSLCLTSLMPVCHISLSLSKTVFLSLDMYLVYRHYGKPLYTYTYSFFISTFGPTFWLLNFRERRQHHESLRPWKQVSFSLL